MLTISSNTGISGLNKINGRSIDKGTNLTHLLHPSVDAGWRDVYKAGWLPYWVNQQWGGVNWGNLPDGSNGDIAIGNVQSDGYDYLGDAAIEMMRSVGFKVGENQTPTGVFLRMSKGGNPTDNFQVQVYSDNAGSPNLALGAVGSLSGKQIISKTEGEWYWIPFAFPALVAGTQYHLVFSRSSGAADAANYYNLNVTAFNKNPHGFNNYGTSAPVWTQQTTRMFCFLIPNPAANAFLQPNGMFGGDNGKIVFKQSTVLNESKLLCKPMEEFFNGKEFTALIRGANWATSSTIADFTYGVDHDRLTVSIDANNHAVVTFRDSLGNPFTVTGTIDARNADIVVAASFYGNGNDYLHLYVNGQLDGIQVNATSWPLSNDWRNLGLAIIGGGFDASPAWYINTDMSVLPSLAGWTWTGGATEALAMSVVNGKLIQNSAGYSSTQAGYYNRATALSNVTGWTVTSKMRVVSNPNDIVNPATCYIDIYDGARRIYLAFSEYYLVIYDGTNYNIVYFDARTKENVYTITGKGNDVYVFVNGKLVFDGTGKMTGATATNSISFGDNTTAASSNSDAVWDYVKVSNTGMYLPKASDGASLSEFGYWKENQTTMTTYLFNGGEKFSIKDACGVKENFINKIRPKIHRRLGASGTVNAPASTAWGALPDMEFFAIGSMFEVSTSINSACSTSANSSHGLTSTLDGVFDELSTGWYTGYGEAAYKQYNNRHKSVQKPVPLGLHKIEVKWFSSTGGGLYISGNGRKSSLKVEI